VECLIAEGLEPSQVLVQLQMLAAANPALGILGTIFETIRWEAPFTPISLAVAFLQGFSERFFDQVGSLLEQHAVKETESAVEKQHKHWKVNHGGTPMLQMILTPSASPSPPNVNEGISTWRG